jgi:F-type H+-transporting ATPase subunit gamma
MAMNTATENAENLIKDLKLLFFKKRQESITKELLEIVAGVEALK